METLTNFQLAFLIDATTTLAEDCYYPAKSYRDSGVKNLIIKLENEVKRRGYLTIQKFIDCINPKSSRLYH